MAIRDFNGQNGIEYPIEKHESVFYKNYAKYKNVNGIQISELDGNFYRTIEDVESESNPMTFLEMADLFLSGEKIFIDSEGTMYLATGINENGFVFGGSGGGGSSKLFVTPIPDPETANTSILVNEDDSSWITMDDVLNNRIFMFTGSDASGHNKYIELILGVYNTMPALYVISSDMANTTCYIWESVRNCFEYNSSR